LAQGFGAALAGERPLLRIVACAPRIEPVALRQAGSRDRWSPDVYRAVYGFQQLTGRSLAPGRHLHHVCYLDSHGNLSSESIHQFGSATLDQNSPPYADQSPLFVARKTKPVLFTQSELARHVESTYRPGEQIQQAAKR
jgi:acyl-homoserine lactone acylase PvdQ